jgi:hypothetical protein
MERTYSERLMAEHASRLTLTFIQRHPLCSIRFYHGTCVENKRTMAARTYAAIWLQSSQVQLGAESVWRSFTSFLLYRFSMLFLTRNSLPARSIVATAQLAIDPLTDEGPAAGQLLEGSGCRCNFFATWGSLSWSKQTGRLRCREDH